jgi:hypothetical protein
VPADGLTIAAFFLLLVVAVVGAFYAALALWPWVKQRLRL